MNAEFFEALALLEKEKGISVEYLCEKIENAIAIAIRRDYVGTEDVKVIIDPETRTFEEIVSMFLPILRGRYWFFTAYFVVMMVSPALNLVIRNRTKGQFRLLLAALFLIFGVIMLTYRLFFKLCHMLTPLFCQLLSGALMGGI